MRSLAAEGYTIIKNEALQRYLNCKENIDFELAIMQDDPDRGGDRLVELLKISAALRDEYVLACDEAIESTI
jgi:hypothetical protein